MHSKDTKALLIFCKLLFHVIFTLQLMIECASSPICYKLFILLSLTAAYSNRGTYIKPGCIEDGECKNYASCVCHALQFIKIQIHRLGFFFFF